jgi:hypothetical protein
VPRKAAAQKQQAQSTQPPPSPPAGDILTLKNHIGQEKGSGDSQDFTANLIKLIAAYTKLEATKEGTVIPPRERMTLLRELIKQNQPEIDKLSDGFKEEIDKRYKNCLKILGAQKGKE